MEPIAIATTSEDHAYVRARYVPFPTRGVPGERDWPGRLMPAPTYRTSDGAQWFAHDWWRLYDDAGGIGGMHALFVCRVRAAAMLIDHEIEPDEEWEAYIAGIYGACLRDVTPETIVLKEALVSRIERTLAAEGEDDAAWRVRLRGDVAMLDGLIRPFAACDRVRFGRSTSRDRLVDDVRRRSRACSCSIATVVRPAAFATL